VPVAGDLPTPLSEASISASHSATGAFTLAATHSQHIQLADKIAEGDCAIAGHSAVRRFSEGLSANELVREVVPHVTQPFGRIKMLGNIRSDSQSLFHMVADCSMCKYTQFVSRIVITLSKMMSNGTMKKNSPRSDFP
jgi:hypothetical protein